MGIFNEIARVEVDGHLIEVETKLRLTCEYRLLVDKLQVDRAFLAAATRGGGCHFHAPLLGGPRPSTRRLLTRT